MQHRVQSIADSDNNRRVLSTSLLINMIMECIYATLNMQVGSLEVGVHISNLSFLAVGQFDAANLAGSE